MALGLGHRNGGFHSVHDVGIARFNGCSRNSAEHATGMCCLPYMKRGPALYWNFGRI